MKSRKGDVKHVKDNQTRHIFDGNDNVRHTNFRLQLQ